MSPALQSPHEELSPEPKRQCLDPMFADLPRQHQDYSLRLPQGWKNIKPADRGWIGHSLFAAKGKLTSNLKLWWLPPPFHLSLAKPSPEQYHRRRLFLWMPRKMWSVDFRCPRCHSPQSLRSRGIYNHVRTVMDIKDFYYLAAEYIECGTCKGTYIAWDCRMLEQLADGVRAHFPAVLTRKYACDRAVITLLRSRTLGKKGSIHSLRIIIIIFQEIALQHCGTMSWKSTVNTGVSGSCRTSLTVSGT